MDNEKKIILDADVIIHFHAGGKLNLLPHIYQNQFIVCDILLEYEILPGPMVQVLHCTLFSLNYFPGRFRG